MDDLEEELLAPDVNGTLNLSHQTWVRLDEVVWSHGQTLLILNVEVNQLVEIPPAIGNLALLRVLDLRHNKLTQLPEEIGHCTQLLELKLAYNHLRSLPRSIHGCIRLQEVNVSYNELEILPKEMGKLENLHILDVRYNKLQTLPETLCECTKLEKLGCIGNDGLSQIPESLRENSALVLWILRRIKGNYFSKPSFVFVFSFLNTYIRI